VVRIVWDNHVCLPLRPDRQSLFTHLTRHLDAGFSVVGVNIGFGEGAWEEHISFAKRLSAWVADNEARFVLVRTVTEMREAAESGRLGIFFDVEGASVLQGQVERIGALADLGVRWMCLTYNKTNELAGGCLEGEWDGGLSALGRAVVLEMNAKGIVVCCSHTGRQSALDVIACSDQPVIFSHSNANSVFNHWRNVDDDVLRACAARGGVICANGVGPFLGRGAADASQWVEHIDHIAQCVGVEHVGLGLDYVYDTEELDELVSESPHLFGEDVRGVGKFTFVPPEALSSAMEELTKRGWSDGDLSRLLGANLMRVAEAVWPEDRALTVP
jgi:membrane dipeptidase